MWNVIGMQLRGLLLTSRVLVTISLSLLEVVNIEREYASYTYAYRNIVMVMYFMNKIMHVGLRSHHSYIYGISRTIHGKHVGACNRGGIKLTCSGTGLATCTLS